jgi:hypothetical protein
MSEKNHSNSNGRKDHNSKGQQNPKSRNPAAGGKARSLSSPHSPAVDNVARGGQEPQPAPFVRAIVSCIKKSAEDHNVSVNFCDVVTFANDYASRMPSKMQEFHQSDVEQALMAFQAVYVPPQPQARHDTRMDASEGSLLRQLRDCSATLRYNRDRFNCWFQDYSQQPNVCRDFSRPTKREVENAILNMQCKISPESIRLNTIKKEGIKPTTVGHEIYKFFREHPEISNYVFAFDRADHLSKYQSHMCMRIGYRGHFMHVAVFARGIHIGPVSISSFKQAASRVSLDPKHFLGKPVLIFPGTVGEFKHQTIEESDDSEDGFDRGFGDGAISGVIRTQMCTSFAAVEKDEESKNGYVPRDYHNIDGSMMHQILENPEYFEEYRKRMIALGGIPVSICAVIDNEVASETVETLSAHIEQVFSKDCKHGVWEGGQVSGKCTRCDWGE